MQAAIYNFIGAFILTIFLVGLWKEKVRLIDIENKIKNLILPLRILIPIILTVEVLYTYFHLFQNNSMAWLNVFFWGSGFLIHEAGHVYASFLGFQTLHVIGGTFLQYFLPAIVFIRSLKQKCFHIAFITLCWIGVQLESTSKYILSTVEESASWNEFILGTHDWKFLLGQLNLISYSEQIANIVWSLGLAIAFFALLSYSYWIAKAFTGSNYHENSASSGRSDIRATSDSDQGF